MCPIRGPGALYLVRFAAPEFTSLCPVTGQPDFAHLVIDYAPERDDRRIQVAEAVSRRVPQSLRLPRGRHRRHRPAAGGRDEAAVAAHRRLLVSARRHPDRRLLADRRAARGPVGARTRASPPIAEGAEPWPRVRRSSSTAPARSAAMSAAPGSPPGSTSASSAARGSSEEIAAHGLAVSDRSGLLGQVRARPDRASRRSRRRCARRTSSCSP